ncbi:MAG: hypothetical protein CMB35_04785 [Euryarchaeota archaeon]|nr:hypothetical protein [Euryarchaeota archaeon]
MRARVRMGTRRAPSLEVDAMNDRIVVGTLDTADCPVHSPISAFFESSEIQDLESEIQQVPDFDAALEQLSSGLIDLLAVPASLMHGRESEIVQSGCEPMGARTPRRPNLVLVSGDRLFYQPKSAVIVSDSTLTRRQLLRARPDLTVIAPEDVPLSRQTKKAPIEAIARARWLGDLQGSGEIDGFVISRAVYESSGQTERRHTLMPFPKDRGGAHFLPPPYSDLIAIIARMRFPPTISKRVTETEGNTALWVQSRVLNEMGDKLAGIIGLQVRHRQVGSLLRQAEEEKDPVMEEACQSADGEILEDQVHVELRMELVSEDGRRTLALNRLVAYSDYQFATLSAIRDWKQLLNEASREVPKDHPTDAAAPPFIVP